MDSCPSQSAITERSTPACRSSIAAEWRSTCGVTRLFLSEGHFRHAAATCLANRNCTPSALSRAPLALGNRMSTAPRCGSRSHSLRVLTVCLVSGVHLSFRPFPMQRTCAPVPNTTSGVRRLVISESRRPVWTAGIATSARPLWARYRSYVRCSFTERSAISTAI